MDNGKNKRTAIVDLWKFIAAVMIMIHHLYYLSPAYEGKDYPGYFSWIYVEFFFILTGYFTYRHFTRQDKQDSIVKSSLSYTWRKFKTFLPYTTTAITLQYLLSAPYTELLQGSYRKFIYSFADYPLEVLLLGEAHGSQQRLVPIWFLSAMLIVFPLVGLLLQLKNKYLILLISGVYPLFYYGRTTLENRVWPDDLLRAAAGLLLGVFICALSDLIREKQLIPPSKKAAKLLTAAEIACMLLSFVFIICADKSLWRVIILLFAAGLSVMLSGRSLTAGLQSPVITY
ncbi:acyltransferase family protein [Ruminococcus sp.]|uniref:acyltransferase family protein n=1 Tax=Ruminococcus sp. TaxID=41978 RepID=UPI00386FF69A